MDTEKHQLEREFEKVSSRPPIRQREVSGILDEVKEHEGMLRLFHFLKQTREHNKLLFLHPLDIFGREGRYQPPHLFYGHSLLKKTRSEQMKNALEVLKIDLQAKGSLSLRSVLGRIGIDVTDESVGHDILDTIVYALISLFRVSPKLLELAQSPEFNYILLREAMKDYSDVLNQEKLKNLISSLIAEQSSDPHLVGLLRNLILTYTPLLSQNPLEFLRATKISQSEVAISYHQAALSFLDSLLEKTSLRFDEYSELMENLYLFGLIDNIHTVFWCERCSKEKISYTEFHGRLSPSNMSGGKCRDCSSKESYSSIYLVDQLLLETIFSRDHFLGVYMAWRIEDANLETRTGTYAGDREIDILVGDTLIECKSFRLGGREDTPRSNMENSLKQIQAQIMALEEEENSVKRVILLSNQSELKNERNNIKGKLRDILERYAIEICGLGEIDEIIESLR